MRRIVSVLIVAMASLCATRPPIAAATTTQGAVQMRYNVTPVITMTVTPNYQSGFGTAGTTGSGAGSGVALGAGPAASLGAGYVDFGNVVQGYQYLYKFAAKLDVASNDPAGFTVFGEGSTDWNGSVTGSYALANVLYWLVSGSSNTAFTVATAFQKTAGTPANGGQNITYGGTPPASATVWTFGTTGSSSRGFDYQMHVPTSIPIDTFSLYVVYTAVGN